MNVIVVGGGNVGYYLVKDLKAAGHDVLLLEKDRARASRLMEELGALVRQGDGCEARVMRDHHFDKADVIVAATGEDEDNLIVCQMAKSHFHVKRAIARVNSPANEVLFKELGIDATVSSTRIIFNMIEQEIETDHIVPVAALAEGQLEIVTTLLSERSPMVGRAVGEVSLPGDAHIVAIIRGQRGILPSPNLRLESGDALLTLVKTDSESLLKDVFAEN
jgi:trk system potassium uptake protein TrkA